MKFSVSQYAEALYHTLSETKPKDQEKVINNFIQVLKTNGDLGGYEAIIGEYEVLDRKMKGIKEVEMVTAHDGEISKEVITSLNSVIGDNIELKKKVDESLIGGIVVKVEDTLIDASVRGHLHKLKNNLSK
jgi:F-type H+-transporting ATPase subunit delta